MEKNRTKQKLIVDIRKNGKNPEYPIQIMRDKKWKQFISHL